MHMYITSPLFSCADGIFGSLSKLTRLHVHGNQIRALDDDLFQNLNAISEIKFADNELTSVPATCLRYIRAHTHTHTYMHTYIHAHTHTHTHIHTYTRIHRDSCTRFQIRMCPYVDTRTDTCITHDLNAIHMCTCTRDTCVYRCTCQHGVCSLARASTRDHTLSYIHTHMRTRAHTHVHTYTHTLPLPVSLPLCLALCHSLSLSHTHSHTHKCVCAYACTCLTYTHAHTYAHTRKHTRTHTHTHTNAYIHTHAHTPEKWGVIWKRFTTKTIVYWLLHVNSPFFLYMPGTWWGRLNWFISQISNRLNRFLWVFECMWVSECMCEFLSVHTLRNSHIYTHIRTHQGGESLLSCLHLILVYLYARDVRGSMKVIYHQDLIITPFTCTLSHPHPPTHWRRERVDRSDGPIRHQFVYYLVYIWY